MGKGTEREAAMAEAPEQYAEKLLTSVNDAAAAVSTRFVTFITVGAYVAVTVASTTHEMLLRASNLVTLPLLNAQIPIIGPFGFYTIAPWLIVLLHSDLLLQLSILANELTRFDQEVKRVPEHQRILLRQRVANFYYVLYFTRQAHSRLLHLLSAFITWVTVVALPLALLLWIQVRFLPFHSAADTWFHRAAVLIDVALIVSILLPHVTPLLRATPKMPGWQLSLRRAVSARTLVVFVCALTVGFSLFVATIPDGPPNGRSWFAQNMELRERVLTANTLSPEDINALRDYTDPEQLRKVLSKVTPLQALQGRDFRYADLYNSILPKLDLRSARVDDGHTDTPAPPDCDARRGCEDSPECDSAAIRRTQLAGANLAWASMQQAMLDDAVVDGANLGWAKVQYGSFNGARLNGAVLTSAKLHEARLDAAKLCGADLSEAELHQAVLRGAYLQGANLRKAKLPAANLERADLRGADLSEADLSDANLRGAQLQGAVLSGAVTRGAIFEDTNVDLTELSASTDAQSARTRTARNAYLVELACANPAVARGLGWQALHSPARDGPGLARALLDARNRAACRALVSLPASIQTDLERVAERARR